MDLAAIRAAAASRSLRPVQTKVAGFNAVGYMSEMENTEHVQATVLDINIEEWIEELADVTMPTAFFSLTIADGELFRDAYLDHVRTQERGGGLPDAGIAARVAALAVRMQAVLEAVAPAGCGEPVFVKTSCRSAKDAPTSQARFEHSFRAAAERKGDASDNALICCLLEAGLETMKTYSAEEALGLFVKSERVYQDMLLALQQPQRWRQNVAIRKWTQIEVFNEFRGFVKGGRLTALSQYNHLCVFPELLGDAACGLCSRPFPCSCDCRRSSATLPAAQQLGAKLAAFFYAKCAPKLRGKFDNYVIDFALDGAGQILVIELNPFLETTDSCLFSWQKERELLENVGVGDVPVVRLRTAAERGVKSLLAVEWRAALEKQQAAMVSAGCDAASKRAPTTGQHGP